MDIVAAEATMADYVKPIGLIDTGLDAVGEIKAVMRRSTYYAHFLEMSINVNAAGECCGQAAKLIKP